MKNNIPDELLEDDTSLEECYEYYDSLEYDSLEDDTIYDECNDYDNFDFGE